MNEEESITEGGNENTEKTTDKRQSIEITPENPNTFSEVDEKPSLHLHQLQYAITTSIIALNQIFFRVSLLGDWKPFGLTRQA
eukprot:snap_masked-scaffold_25-processed-gene-5.28-mRNA-1 protein AED:1.00 eAED:1.00 QI:0/-1/0/0/-1/1/1/0/82